MASAKNLQELFHDTLKDIYFAEKILSALPKGGLTAAHEVHSPTAYAETSERCRSWILF